LVEQEVQIDVAVELLDVAIFHDPEVVARNIELGSVPLNDSCRR